jgi:hypothetical protein
LNIEIIAVGNLSTSETKKEIDSEQENLYYVGSSNRIDLQYIDKYNLELIKDIPKKDNYASFQIYKINHEN